MIKLWSPNRIIIYLDKESIFISLMRMRPFIWISLRRFRIELCVRGSREVLSKSRVWRN